MTKLVNGVEVPLTEEDLAQIAQDEADHAARVAAMNAALAAATARSEMKTLWDALPSWINAWPEYAFAFESCSRQDGLLDEKKYTRAIDLIQNLAPHAAILADETVYPELGDRTKAQYFAFIKTAFQAAISSFGS